MADQPLPRAQAELVAAGLHEAFPPGNPYEVPEHERLDDDSLDPNSVADPDGTDLSDVDPDAGEVLDLRGRW